MNVNDRRFWRNVAISAIWLACAVGLLFWTELPSKANEWGDYFAGVFAPLAFFWLVLGYRQQGEELRLQALELKNSVVQQTAMVSVARDQLEDSRLAQARRDEDRKRAVRPEIRVECDGARGDILDLRMINKGGALRSVGWQFQEEVATERPVRLERGGDVHLLLRRRNFDMIRILLVGVTDVDETVYLMAQLEPSPGGLYKPAHFEPVSQADWDLSFIA